MFLKSNTFLKIILEKSMILYDPLPKKIYKNKRGLQSELFKIKMLNNGLILTGNKEKYLREKNLEKYLEGSIIIFLL